MKKNLLYILAVVLLSFSCTEDDSVYVAPANGQEVKFTANLENSKQGSRTLYGEEVDSDNDGTNDGIKVNWVNGDKITVYGSTCATGRNQASYTVNAANSGTQNYADKLERIGEIGVQWGSEKTSDFYAVYPAIGGTFSPAGFEMEIREQQNNYFEKKTTTNANGETVIVWEGTPYVDDIKNLTMQDALMYAYEKGVTNGSDVDLTFKPFSTVLKFRLDGWTFFQVTKNENGEILSTTPTTSSEPAYISKIIIQILDETAIAGKCNFKFIDGVPTFVDGGSESAITIYPDYLPLSNNESVEFSAFVIPQEYEMSKNTPWIVTLETSNFGTHTFIMEPEIVEGVIPTILPGKIHKIDIPNLPITSESQFDLTGHLGNWMRYIPRNVYLSELSLPGAWYATNSSYQTTTDLTTQYKAGIRAFNIDCRMTYKSGRDGDMDLYCAGSEGSSLGYITSEGKTVLSALQEIAAMLPETNPTEYVVAVLTIAEFEKTDSDRSLGTVAPYDVLNAIYSMLSANAKSLKLYTDKITANTTVNDVLGKMIVKINVNSDIATFTKFDFWKSYSTTNYALVSEGSMSAVANTTSNITKANFKTMNTAPMYWGNELINNPELSYYYHQAQRTYSTNPYTDTSIKADDEQYLGVPTLAERIAAIDDIIDNSSTIYAAGTHNAWYQLGIGGYVRDRKFTNIYVSSWWGDDGNEDWGAVATSLNAHVLDKIQAKLKNDPSPVGLVLMNFCTNNTYKSVDLVNAIVKMNTKFYLNRNKNAEEWPGSSSPFE